MSSATLFDGSYENQKKDLLRKVLDQVRSIFTDEELKVLRIDPINRAILSQRSGRGFVNRDLLETVLGNLLECVAPGSHNALEEHQTDVAGALEEIADQLYAMIAQSLLAAGAESDIEESAIQSTFALLADLPALKDRARWNRFASLKDPAVWDAYIRQRIGFEGDQLASVNLSVEVNKAIADRNFDGYREYLSSLGLSQVFDYQMQLVISTYPGWRVLFYHDIAHALTLCGTVDSLSGIRRSPVPLLPRAISELGGRYYQADLHPETVIGDANFLEHPHRGLTTGQTGIIGRGCVIYPSTLGGISDKVKQRHPMIGDFVTIGTDATMLGPVSIGEGSTVGTSSYLYGNVETGSKCRIASSVVIGTVMGAARRPGKIRLGEGVRVGDGTVIENSTELDLLIPDKAEIPARSYVVNDGFGRPRIVQE